MNEVKLDTRELDRIARQLGVKVEAVGRKLAFDIEDKAKQNAPVDTSAMRNSIYTVTQKEDGYAAASAAAKQANPKVETQPHPTPTGKIIANVGPCVEYSEYVEFGTSRMAAQPYLTPAVEEVARKLNDGSTWKEIVE